MTPGNIHLKILAAITMKPHFQALADDAANGKTVCAAAAVFVTFIEDVLPVYKSEADRQGEELKQQVEKDRPKWEAADAKMKAQIAAIKPYPDPYHI